MLIHDKKEFEKFVNIVLPDIEKDEVYFMSLSARNKYLSDEERKFYELGRTEMFGREVFKSKEYILENAINIFESRLKTKKTKNGKPIPEQCLVLYANINPSSMVKAYMSFQKDMNRQIQEITSSLMLNKIPNYDSIKKADRSIINSIQKNTSRKYYIDIDFDSKNIEILDNILNYLSEVNSEFYVIDTVKGFHILIKKDTLPDDNILYKKIHDCHVAVEGEVCFNKNMMVPVPGTYQASHKVKFLEV